MMIVNFSSNILCELIGYNDLPHAVFMCVLLCCEDLGDAHVCQMPIVKLRIPRDCKFLAHIHLVKTGFLLVI